MAVGFAAINQDGADRGGVGIVDWQPLKSIAAHQLVPRFGGIGGLRIGTDHAGRKQSMLHIMPAGCLRLCVRAFLSERRGARESWVKAWIDLRERMNNGFRPVMVNDPNGRDLTGCVSVNELFGRFLQAFSSKAASAKGESARA